MNRSVGYTFDGISASASVYKASVKEALTEYTTGQRKAQEAASRFKDEKGEFEKAMQPVRAKAKATISAAGKELSKDLKHSAAQLRETMLEHLTEPISPDVAKKLSFYRDYQIAPSRMEITALLKQNNGCTSGVRALASLLDRLEAPQRLKVRGIEEFENDIERLERLAVVAEHTPLFDVSDLATGTELYRGDKQTQIRKDGSKYEDGQTMDFISLNLARVNFETTTAQLERNKATWQADISCTIEDAIDAEMLRKETAHEEAVAEIENREPMQQERPESSTTIEEEGNAIKLARELGKAQAGTETINQLKANYAK